MSDGSLILLGFDFGEKRIGIAKGQTISHTAEPLTILNTINGKIDWSAITELLETWQPDKLIVGLPELDSGEDHPMAPLINKFCRQLEGRYHLPVETINEVFSSVEASFRLNRKSGDLDAVAAQVILETWMQELP